MPRLNKQITITAGTPVNVFTGLTTAVGREEPAQHVGQIFIQSRVGNSGIVYVMAGVPRTVVADATNADHLTAELAVSPDAGNPGGAYFSNTLTIQGDDISLLWIDGAHTGDKVIVSYML